MTHPQSESARKKVEMEAPSGEDIISHTRKTEIDEELENGVQAVSTLSFL